MIFIAHSGDATVAPEMLRGQVGEHFGVGPFKDVTHGPKPACLEDVLLAIALVGQIAAHAPVKPVIVDTGDSAHGVCARSAPAPETGDALFAEDLHIERLAPLADDERDWFAMLAVHHVEPFFAFFSVLALGEDSGQEDMGNEIDLAVAAQTL